MKIETKTINPNAVLISLAGRLDIAGAAAVEKDFAGAAGSARVVVVDLSQTPFMASIGIRLLLANAKLLGRRGGRMALFGCDPQVEKVLRSTGVDQLISIVATLDAALAAAGAAVGDGTA